MTCRNDIRIRPGKFLQVSQAELVILLRPGRILPLEANPSQAVQDPGLSRKFQARHLLRQRHSLLQVSFPPQDISPFHGAFRQFIERDQVGLFPPAEYRSVDKALAASCRVSGWLVASPSIACTIAR